MSAIIDSNNIMIAITFYLELLCHSNHNNGNCNHDSGACRSNQEAMQSHQLFPVKPQQHFSAEDQWTWELRGGGRSLDLTIIGGTS